MSRRGSARYASFSACQSALRTPGTSLSSRLGICNVEHLLGFLDVEARCLQLEHRLVSPAGRHELVMGAELDDASVLQHADAIRVADGREPVGDEDHGPPACRLQKPI